MKDDEAFETVDELYRKPLDLDDDVPQEWKEAMEDRYEHEGQD